MTRFKPIDLSRVKTIPVKKRRSKVSIKDFASPSRPQASLKHFFNTFPHLLRASDFLSLVEDIVRARRKGKPVIAMMGAHLIKCGLNPILLDLMKRKILTSIALNGAGSIHDFEIALFGETSEDVAAGLKEGTF